MSKTGSEPRLVEGWFNGRLVLWSEQKQMFFALTGSPTVDARIKAQAAQ